MAAEALSDPREAAYASRAKARGITPEKARELSDEDIQLSRKQFLSVYEDQKDLRARLKADHDYVDGVYADGKSKRWTTQDKTDRSGRPMLSIDAMGGPIAQVSNGLAEARPAADMMPLGRGADDDGAEVWEGLIRRVQTAPEAEFAGAYAADHLVKLGWGSWVLTAKYPDYNGDPLDPANWEMELCRKWIENQHAVWLGPATEPDGSDRMFGFILQPLTEDLFDERFGEGEYKKNKSAFAELGQVGAGMTAWQSEHTVTVASWYRVKSTKVTIQAQGQMTGERVVSHRIVCLSTITATREYTYDELPIPYVPIIHGLAKRSNIDGDKDVKGMVRGMKDPQDLVNVYPSYIAETVAQGARTEVIAFDGQIDEQNKGFWDTSKRLPYRLAHPTTTLDGTLVPPPVIQTFEPPIQGMTLALQQAESFVRKAALLYDSDSDETGAQLSKMSGRAMIQRDRKGELGNSDFMRAYQFMILFEVKLILAWAPSVYSAARALRFSGRNEESFAAVTYFGEQFQQDAQQLAQSIPPPKGQQKPVRPFNLKAGRYDMKARVIKNPLTQKEENAQIVRDVLPTLPPQLQARAMPIFFEEGIGGTIGKRLAAAVSPNQETVPIEEAKKAQAFIDALEKRVGQLEEEIERKTVETQSKERIASEDNATKLALEERKFQHEMQLEEMKLKYELEKLKIQAQMATEARREGFDHDHMTAALEHVEGQSAAEREHEHAMEMQASKPNGKGE